MPTPTYDLIASNVLSSSASSVTFSSIPATYRDLIVVVQYLSSTGTASLELRLNSDTGANYHRVWMVGDGSTASSFSETSATEVFLSSDTGAGTTGEHLSVIQIMDYSATDKHKTILSRGNRASSGVTAQAARWANTAAVNTVLLRTSSNNFASGSSFYLYGLVS